MRAFWSGEIAFGLVTIPVKLYTATKDQAPAFQQLHKECGTKINMVRRCPRCERDVKWNEIGKGYEVSKGEYALFTAEELEKLEGDDGAGAIEIAEFIDPREVDLAYLEKSYWVGPGGKSTRGYELLRGALEQSKKVALAKVKLRTRTRLALLRPRGKLFALETMRFAEEILPSDEIEVLDGKKSSDREVQLALDLVEQLSATFDATKHPDAYRAAFDAAVQEKIEKDALARDEGGAGAADEAGAGGTVIDLADLLARSLKGGAAASAKKSKVANDSEPPAAMADEESKPGPKKVAASPSPEAPAASGGARKSKRSAS